MLVDVYSEPGAVHVLWELLRNRQPDENISHREMPTWIEHTTFVYSRPYLRWYLIKDEGYCGACYLSKQREIGVAIFESLRGNGYGSEAVRVLMAKHPGRFLANVAPGNFPSHKLFESLNFKPLQVTYVLE